MEAHGLPRYHHVVPQVPAEIFDALLKIARSKFEYSANDIRAYYQIVLGQSHFLPQDAVFETVPMIVPMTPEEQDATPTILIETVSPPPPPDAVEAHATAVSNTDTQTARIRVKDEPIALRSEVPRPRRAESLLATTQSSTGACISDADRSVNTVDRLLQEELRPHGRRTSSEVQSNAKASRSTNGSIARKRRTTHVANAHVVCAQEQPAPSDRSEKQRRCDIDAGPSRSVGAESLQSPSLADLMSPLDVRPQSPAPAPNQSTETTHELQREELGLGRRCVSTDSESASEYAPSNGGDDDDQDLQPSSTAPQDLASAVSQHEESDLSEPDTPIMRQRSEYTKVPSTCPPTVSTAVWKTTGIRYRRELWHHYFIMNTARGREAEEACRRCEKKGLRCRYYRGANKAITRCGECLRSRRNYCRPGP